MLLMHVGIRTLEDATMSPEAHYGKYEQRECQFAPDVVDGHAFTFMRSFVLDRRFTQRNAMISEMPTMQFFI